MCRPPHEDPEYQRQIVGNFRQGILARSQQQQSVKHTLPLAGPINIPFQPLQHHNYTWSQQSPVSFFSFFFNINLFYRPCCCLESILTDILESCRLTKFYIINFFRLLHKNTYDYHLVRPHRQHHIHHHHILQQLLKLNKI